MTSGLTHALRPQSAGRGGTETSFILDFVDPAEVLLRTPIFRDLTRRDVQQLLPELRQRVYARGESV